MDSYQTTERVEEKRGTAALRAPGVLHRPLPQAVTLPLLFLLAYAGLMALINYPVLHVYQKHFGEKLPHASVPWEALSSGLDEGALRASFQGVPLRCTAEGSHLGDRVCYAAVQQVDGHPALTLALFLRKGRLVLATVHVPWWAHGRAADALAQRLGASQPASGGPLTPLRRWTVPGGVVDMNARPSMFNVLAWSAIVWTPRGGK